MVLEGPILRVTLFPSSTELSLTYGETLNLKRRIGIRRVKEAFLCPFFAIILKRTYVFQIILLDLISGNKKSVNIFMIEGRNRNIKEKTPSHSNKLLSQNIKRNLQRSLNQQPLEMCKVSVHIVCFLYLFKNSNMKQSLTACQKSFISLPEVLLIIQSN